MEDFTLVNVILYSRYFVLIAFYSDIRTQNLFELNGNFIGGACYILT